ncbi:unnamed protein product [Durusdinium trenchii]|uniref:Uncharacterized protein n=1 Tax=Durusdinium trenchii TaxID=1381693 RepID=A0ABP0PBH8_9DINO
MLGWFPCLGGAHRLFTDPPCHRVWEGLRPVWEGRTSGQQKLHCPVCVPGARAAQQQAENAMGVMTTHTSSSSPGSVAAADPTVPMSWGSAMLKTHSYVRAERHGVTIQKLLLLDIEKKK